MLRRGEPEKEEEEIGGYSCQRQERGCGEDLRACEEEIKNQQNTRTSD